MKLYQIFWRLKLQPWSIATMSTIPVHRSVGGLSPLPQVFQRSGDCLGDEAHAHHHAVGYFAGLAYALGAFRDHMDGNVQGFAEPRKAEGSALEDALTVVPEPSNRQRTSANLV